MRIISIGSVRSRTGKTTVGTFLAARLTGFCTLKVTTLRPGDRCHGSGVPDEGYELTAEREIPEIQGKDTALYREAGSPLVLWLRSTPDHMEEGVRTALCSLPPCHGLIVEGNSPSPFLPDALRIFINNPESGKESALWFLNNAHILLVPPGMEGMQSLRCRVIPFSRDDGTWKDELLDAITSHWNARGMHDPPRLPPH